MSTPKELSIVIPAYNEAGNVGALVERLHQALIGAGIAYELIFIDDRSTDGTREMLEALIGTYPSVTVHMKQGKRGKAQSLLEGFAYARYAVIAMIDADLQYPPEALPEMFEKIAASADIVVANRQTRKTSAVRQLFSHGFAFFFGRLLHRLTCDVQSGLKMFRTRVLTEVHLAPTPWTFDLGFLLQARDAGRTIEVVDITFAERATGQSKVNVLRGMFEIGWNALALKFRRVRPTAIVPDGEKMVGAGIAHRRHRFITHTTLSHHVSAIQTFTFWQKTLIALFVVLMATAFVRWPLPAGIALIGVLSTVYFVDMLFNLFLVIRSLRQPPEITSTPAELTALDEAALPTYTVLCPLYREAHILPGFLAAMERLEWPKEKLDVMLLLEADDAETIAAAEAQGLPPYVRVVVVPHSLPKTKPKACNYGLNFARGEYLVIYDAEDIPDPQQLKKAYLGFQKVPANVKCLQAKLNYHNPEDNLLTRFFTAEYSLWFDVTLTGLQTVEGYIPLGGTSNHFRTDDLRSFHGWDAFNVTEDCDLGARIFKLGYQTAIIDSVTLEEANSNVRNWLRQRSRWIKGYMQTYLVHVRNPFTLLKKNGVMDALMFQLVVGGKIMFLLINPLLWLATIAYFVLYAHVGEAIEALYPSGVFYMAATSLVFGNFLYIYYYMIGLAKRGSWSLLKYIFLVPIYWLMASVAALIAAYQLIVKPHYWEKTNHGLAKGTVPVPASIPAGDARVPSMVAPSSVSSEVSPVVVFEEEESVPEELGATPPAEELPAPSFPRRTPPFASFLPGGLTLQNLSGASFLMVAIMVSNALNFLFNAYLGRVLSYEELALITLVNTLALIVSFVVSALGGTVNRTSAYLAAAGDVEADVGFFWSVLAKSLRVTLILSIIWLAASPFLARYFHISGVVTIWLLVPALVFGALGSISRGFLQGNLLFSWVGLLYVLESALKLVLAGFLVELGYPQFAHFIVPVSVFITALVGLWIVFPYVNRPSRQSTYAFPWAFFAASVMAGISTTLFFSIDILLAKHYLDATQAGQYAVLALVGKVIFFLASLPSAFLVTFVARDEGLGVDPRRSLRIIFGSTVGLVALGVIGLGFFGPLTTPLLFGAKASAIFAYLIPYSIAIGLFTLTSTLVWYHLARRQYIFPATSLVASALIAVSIMFAHGGLADIVRAIMLASTVGFAAVALLHRFEGRVWLLERAALDFAAAFRIPATLPPRAGAKRILIFNWRDTRHAYAGGAETYAHEVARHWVVKGHEVTLFCGNDGKELREETIDGVRVIRRGGFYFVYVWAFIYYLTQFRRRFDVIIDCHNGVPFFTPLYAGEPVYCLMHHVHQEVFRHSLPRPLAAFASFLEKDLMPLVYRNVKFITVSNSSREDIERLGLAPAGVQVVSPGVNLEELRVGQKSETPLLLYLGRLKAYKSIDTLLVAFKRVLAEAPEASLVIAGDGEERGHLERLASQLDVAHRTKFVGKVSESEKLELLQRAWVMVNPSFMEGWGITTIEANACGTPVVAADVPGLRDSVNDFATGFLVPHGDSAGFAERILFIIRDKKLRAYMSKESVEWAGKFDWAQTGAAFLRIIKSDDELPQGRS